jgi:GMP synthase-like glutamine amidotransferase
MKPVAIIRFSPTEGPGYLSKFLDEAGIPWQLIRIDAGEPLPADCSAYAGIAMMGGPMSVNDPLPWIPPLLALIRDAVRKDIPLLGHCLGGQMMAKAMGGAITDNPCMEKGWHTVEVLPQPEARQWFGGIEVFTTFQWHYQTFSIPPGAMQILRNDYCENQAFAHGPHIGFQCHIEMTVEMVREWCKSEDDSMAGNLDAPSVQSVSEIQDDLDVHVGRLNRVADAVYSRWIRGLK